VSTDAALSIDITLDILPGTNLPVDCDTPVDLPYCLTAAVTANTNISPWVFVHLREAIGPPPVDVFCAVASVQNQDTLGQGAPSSGQASFLLTTMSSCFASLEDMLEFKTDLIAMLDQLVRDTTCKNNNFIGTETVILPLT